MTRLSIREVEAPDADPRHEVWFLHGILGSGRNWRSLARKLVRARPAWRAVLVDLRGHGDSPPGDPPHTLEACADDLDALAARRGPARVVVGHSFGGKVALAWGARHDEVAGIWVLDAVPGPAELSDRRPGDDVANVIATVGDVAMPVEGYDELVATLTERGLSRSVAQWMTTNLDRRDDGFHWTFDLDVVRDLIADYADTDLWPLAETHGARVHLVRAGRSDRWTDRDRERWAALPHHEIVEDAGHWLHAEAPEATLDLLCSGLDAATP